jgi:DNA-binding FrmR family transcriptional regulator
MKAYPSHKKHMDALRRIEGQIRGVQKMVEEKRYCVDILTQLSAVSSAVASVQNSILERHFDTCFKSAFENGSAIERKKKISEVLKILKTFRKNI